MTGYRRADFPGGYYFFTVVTHQRRHHKFVKSGYYRHRTLNDFDGDFGEDYTGE